MRVMAGNSTKHRKRQGHTWKAWSNTQQTEPTDCNVKNRHTPAVGRGPQSDVINTDEPHAEFWRHKGRWLTLPAYTSPTKSKITFPGLSLEHMIKPNTPDCMEGRHLQKLTGRGYVGQRGRPAFRPQGFKVLLFFQSLVCLAGTASSLW